MRAELRFVIITCGSFPQQGITYYMFYMDSYYMYGVVFQRRFCVVFQRSHKAVCVVFQRMLSDS